MRAKDAWDRAADCAARAETSTDERTRTLFTKLRDSWIRVANDRELAALAGPDQGPAQHVATLPKQPISPGGG